MSSGPGNYGDVDRATYGIPKSVGKNVRGIDIPVCYVTFECPTCRFKAVEDAFSGAVFCLGTNKSHGKQAMIPIALYRGE